MPFAIQERREEVSVQWGLSCILIFSHSQYNNECTDFTGIPPLSSTNGDADEMRKTFEQFDYDIRQLKNGAATEHAITALLKQASDYLSRCGGPKKNRDGEKKVVIFAFSGHGTSCGTSEDQ